MEMVTNIGKRRGKFTMVRLSEVTDRRNHGHHFFDQVLLSLRRDCTMSPEMRSDEHKDGAEDQICNEATDYGGSSVHMVTGRMGTNLQNAVSGFQPNQTPCPAGETETGT